ncbi:Holliday junction resolvase RuvX [Candidatus Marinamargulisbacteria bacterium SCGC AG-414-C22]|nr:Holliday junction resolvase RuvX [Candidatus Marinamargulisbacteria bacterium SCGC AG-414-C22]
MNDRIACLDYGEKRIGVAVGDPLGVTAQPKPFILNNPQIVTNIQQLIEEFDIKTLYIGLPKDTRGGETKKSEEVRAFVEDLKEHISIPIAFVDERFSTVAATRQLDELGINRKKQRQKIDSQAAAFMLQGVLDQL